MTTDVAAATASVIAGRLAQVDRQDQGFGPSRLASADPDFPVSLDPVPATSNRLWFRGIGGVQESDPSGMAVDTQHYFGGMVLGVDERLDTGQTVFAGQHHMYPQRPVASDDVAGGTKIRLNDFSAFTGAITAATLERGLITIRAGLYINCVRFLPPLNITNEQIAEGMAILEEAIASL